MKIRPLRADLFLADGWTDGETDRQTDITKLNVAFRNFLNPSKNYKTYKLKEINSFFTKLKNFKPTWH